MDKTKLPEGYQVKYNSVWSDKYAVHIAHDRYNCFLNADFNTKQEAIAAAWEHYEKENG